MDLTIYKIKIWLVVAACISTSHSQGPACGRSLDLAIVLDSGKQPVDSWNKLQTFAQSLVAKNEFTVGQSATRVAIIEYSNGTNSPFWYRMENFNDNLVVQSSIGSLSLINGGRDLTAALLLLRTEVFASVNGGRSNASNVAVLIISGEPDTGTATLFSEALAVSQSNIRLLVVGTANATNSTVQALSSPPKISGVTFWVVPSIFDLGRITQTLVTAACSRVAACSFVDIALLVDDSSDVTISQWTVIKNFIKAFVGSFAIIGRNDTQVALVTYDDAAVVVFSLNQFSSQSSVNAAVDNLPLKGGGANIAAGLQAVQQTVFQLNYGDRATAVNILILLTAGASSVNRNQTVVSAQILQSSGAQILVVAFDVTSSAALAELTNVASGPAYVINVNTAIGIDEQVDSTLSIACQGAQRSVCTNFGDILLIVDESSSIFWAQSQNWNPLITNFLTAFVLSHNVGLMTTHIGLVTFSSNATLRWNLTSYLTEDSLVQAISELNPRGGETDIADALRLAEREMATNGRSGLPHLFVLVTDGFANIEADQTLIEANKTRASGTAIVCIGITASINQNELISIAGTASRVFTVDTFQGLTVDMPSIAIKTCDIMSPIIVSTTRSSTSLTTMSTAALKTTSVTVALTSTSSPTFSPTTVWPPPTQCYGPLMDVVFIIGGYNPFDVQAITTFLQQLILLLDVDSGRIRIAVATFSTSTNVVFQLNTYDTRLQMWQALSFVSYHYQTANISDSFRTARNVMLTASNGRRSGVRGFVVLITDIGSIDEISTVLEAKLLLNTGVEVFAIGIGNWLNVNELKESVSFSYSSHVALVANASTLSSFVIRIKEIICFDVDPCASSSCFNGQCINNAISFVCSCPPNVASGDCLNGCQSGSDILFIVDSGTSVLAANFRLVNDFVTNITRSLSLDSGDGMGCRVAFIQFASTALVRFYLDDYVGLQENLLSAFTQPFIGGSHNAASALSLAATEIFNSTTGDRATYPNIVVYITNNWVSDNTTATWLAAKALRERGTQILVISVGDGWNLAELQAIASFPTDVNILLLSSYVNLTNPQLVQNVSNTLCRDVNPCSSNPCQNGAACTMILNGFSCFPCPLNYTGKLCNQAASSIVDVMIALDASKDWRNNYFPVVTGFLAQFVSLLDVGPSRTQVGIMYWNDQAHMLYGLSQLTLAQDLMTAVKATPYLYSNPNTAAALRLLLNSAFSIQNGDRIYAPNVVIMVTNGNTVLEQDAIFSAARDLRYLAPARIITVSQGKIVNNYVISGLASMPNNDNILWTMNITDLNSLVQLLYNGIFNESNNHCSNMQCSNGGSCQYGLGSTWCQCASGWAGSACNQTCIRRQLDIVFLIDLSLLYPQARAVLQQLPRLMAALWPIQGADMWQVGATVYSSNVIPEAGFYMNTFTSKDEVLNALYFANLNLNTNGSNASKGMGDARTNQFTYTNGDRPSAPNVIISLTSGSADPVQAISESDLVKSAGIKIYTIAIGSYANFAQLNAISSQPSSTYVIPWLFTDSMTKLAGRMLTLLCSL